MTTEGGTTMIDLEPFCGEMKKIAAPWSVGEFTFATDGHMLIRVHAYRGAGSVADC
jgi:hypothetical protein